MSSILSIISRGFVIERSKCTVASPVAYETTADVMPGTVERVDSTVELHEEDAIAATIVRRLATQAVALNERLGDPTADVRPSGKGRSSK